MCQVGWSVVLFFDTNEVEAVPSSWLYKCHRNEKECWQCWWPPKDTIVTDSIKNQATPSPTTWQTFSVRILGDNYGK